MCVNGKGSRWLRCDSNEYSLNPLTFSVMVSVDGRKVSVEEIVEKLIEGGYPVSGEPQMLERYRSAAGTQPPHVLRQYPAHPPAIISVIWSLSPSLTRFASSSGYELS